MSGRPKTVPYSPDGTLYVQTTMFTYTMFKSRKPFLEFKEGAGVRLSFLYRGGKMTRTYTLDSAPKWMKRMLREK